MLLKLFFTSIVVVRSEMRGRCIFLFKDGGKLCIN